MFASKGIAFSKLFVADLDVSAAFYRSALGFEPGPRFSAPDFDELVLRTLGGTGSLVLCRWKDGRALVLGNCHGPVGIAVADTDAAYANCRAAGASPELEPVTFGNARIAIFRDLDGHAIELIAYQAARSEPG